MAMPVVDGVAESHNLIDLLRKNPTKELRIKLRSKLASVISEVLIAVHAPRKRYVKLAWVQVKFRHTDYVRNIVFGHLPALRSRPYERPEVVWVDCSYETPASDAFFDDKYLEKVHDMMNFEQAKLTLPPDQVMQEAERLAKKWNVTPTRPKRRKASVR